MTASRSTSDRMGLIFDIDTFAVHDGPGIRLAVYLKGCPLTCQWCHSPESQRREPELILVHERCVLCGTCSDLCAEAAHAVTPARHSIDRERCLVCGRCVEHCPNEALAVKGEWISASDILAKAVRLRPFFDHSGGGVTLTGGEVTAQATFAEAVLAGCRRRGIHTAIETCGATSWARLERLVRHTDLVLYDIKLIDPSQHQQWTGATNGQILENARRLARGGYNVQVRVPLIPGITDTEENIDGILNFMGEIELMRVALLPYNPAAGAKYEWLDRPYGIAAEPQSEQRLAELLSRAHRNGVQAIIG